MGNLLSSIWGLFFQQEREIKLALVGLDGSGKTTIISKIMDPNYDQQTLPTIGIASKDFKINNISIKVFDLAGQENMRNAWKYYFSSTEGIIFVIDASDSDRVNDVKTEIWEILRDNTADKIPMLVYANKQDLPNAMSIESLMQDLDIDDNTAKNPKSLRHFQASACKGNQAGLGLTEGF